MKPDRKVQQSISGCAAKGKSKSRRRKRKPSLEADETKAIKATDVPSGSEFTGYADFYVQELIIKSVTTLYRREQWLIPDSKTLTAKLEMENGAPHFGPTLCSFVLYQYYPAQVTEPLMLEALRDWGVRISSGQLHLVCVVTPWAWHRLLILRSKISERLV